MAMLTLKFVTDVRDMEYEIVKFHGELDQSTLKTAETQIDQLVETTKSQYLIFDLSDMKFTNSEGVGFIISTHVKLVKRKRQLYIAAPKSNVQEVFDLIGLPKIISVFSSINEAISFIKKK
ncbi:STAS domain-containing protein [Candidatus Peregrinibacteria bacterium]|nr:STAS domain-containing protein [Candidatus Peregrinibacteria bacterium]